MNIISNVLLSTATILLLGGGIYFSIKMCFPQLLFITLFKGFKEKDNLGISPFKSLMISLAARIGVGSVAGIALAIYLGGSGTIFWIWIIGLITSINSYAESYLGAKYQENNNGFKGGPSYYIEKGLHNKKLAAIYSILVIIVYIFGFMAIQANTITISIASYYKTSGILIAIILTFITAVCIKELKHIVNITSKIVPLIGICYVLLLFFIIIKNINVIPKVLINIVKEAWNVKSLTSSFIPIFFIGMKRGVFSTEAGLGTGSIASSTTFTKNKVNLGLIQILGIYFTVFIICTGTALIILSSNYQTIIVDNGIELTQYALNYHLGSFGSNLLIIIVFFLAFSTIIAGYYYGECSYNYLFKNRKTYFLKLLTLLFLFLGSILSSSILWQLTDILICLLAIINMYALLKLRKEIIFDYKNSK